MLSLLVVMTGCGPMPSVHRAIDGGDYDAARRRLVAALDEAPEDRELLWWLARVEMLDEAPERARVVLGRLLAHHPDDIEARIELGITFELTREYEAALEAYAEATRRAPESAHAHRWLGQRLLRWGQHEEALAPLERALELDEGEVEAWGALGRAKLLAGDAAGAEAVLVRAIERHPRDRDLRLALGLVHLSQSRWAEALALYDEVVARWPGFAPAHTGRGILLDTIGRRSEALAAFERAAALDPRERSRLAAYGARLEEERREP